MVRYYTIPPPADLAPYIKSFWVYEVDLPGGRPYVYRSMADGCAEMLFHYKSPFAEICEKDIIHQGCSLLQGPLKKFKRFVTTESFGIFGVYFYPFAIPVFFNLPVSEICNQLPEIDLFMGIHGRILEEQIMLAKNNNERLAILTQFLRQRLKSQKYSSNIVPAIQQTIAAKGSLSIELLSSQFCLSRRQFERKFKEFAGFSPKLYARIIRFQSCLREYKHMQQKSLTQIAYEYGYYDQSHFIHDFKEFSGYHPRQYFYSDIEGGEWRNA